jgi:hypothetical protein
MVFAMQQGWPLAPNVPILQGPFGKGKLHDAQVVAVAPGTRGPLASGTYTKGPPAPSGPAATKTSDGDRRAPSGSGLTGSQTVVAIGPGSEPSGGGGPAGGGEPDGGEPDGDTQPVTAPQPAPNPTPPQGVSNGNGRQPITAGVSPSQGGGGQRGSKIRGPARSTHERESPPSFANDERSSHEREESPVVDDGSEDSDHGESESGRSEHER